ncbi:hypothetical protein ADL26_11170 [Thermoactinomyces vulgaris]|nr:hypothetical protein ADL26_11170 [Thermoactinomyces vulgaris]
MSGKIRYQRQLEKFTAALRELRRRAGNPTLRTMCRRCKNQVSLSTLQRVDTGKGIPRLESVLWYVKACDGDEGLWRRQYSDLETAVRTGSKPRFVPWVTYSADAKKPITDASALRREMRNLKLGSGLTLKEIAKQTEGNSYIAAASGIRGLSTSTIGDLCNPKRTHIPRRSTLHAFLLAVGVEQKDIETWMAIRSELAVRQDERRGKGSGGEVSAHSAPPAQRPGAARLPRRKAAPKVDPITRFRVLRNDMAHGTLNSPERVLNVLVGIGLAPVEAQALSGNRTILQAFVTYLDREMHGLMAGGKVTSAGASVALELALFRTMTRFRMFLEREPVRQSEPDLMAFGYGIDV